MRRGSRLTTLFRTFVAIVLTAAFTGQVRASQEPIPIVHMESRIGPPAVIQCPMPEFHAAAHAALARSLHAVLVSDLRNSGIFQVQVSRSAVAGDSVAAPADLDLQIVMRSLRSKGLRIETQLKDHSTGRSVFSKAYASDPEALRKVAHKLSDDIVERVTGVRGVAESNIVFARRVFNGIKEIYAVDQDGENLRQITRNGSLTISPSLSPDGRLAYLTYKGGPPEIWGQKVSGGAHERLYPFSEYLGGAINTPVWAPDNRHLAFVQSNHNGDADIWMLEMGSRELRRLTDQTGINSEPSWSPSGASLAFTSDRSGSPQIYLLELAGGTIRRLTLEGSYNASPAWSPQGDMIAYVSRFEGRFNIFVYAFAENRSYQVTSGMGSAESPDWSPDGRWLVFTSNREGSSKLYITDLTGEHVRPVVDLDGCQSPKWVRSG